MRRARWFLLLGLALAGCRAAPVIERLDPRFDEVVPKDAVVEAVVTGLTWLEGPAVDPRDGALFFSEIPENRIWRWQAGGNATAWLAASGWSGSGRYPGREPGSNGLAFDGEGRLVLCQHGDRRLARRQKDGTITGLAEAYRGQRLNSPNDVCVAGNGDLYFTDPPFGLPGGHADPRRELAFYGVYRLSARGELTLLVRDLSAPNGIALSPDETTLYVANADARRPVVMAYPLRGDGSLGTGRVLWDATRWLATGPGNPDGVDVDARGRVFVGGPGGVYVLAADGTHLGTLRLGVATANCALADQGRTLFVTASDTVYRVKL